MSIVVSAGESRTFAPAPAGLHQACCVDVVDMGLLEVTYSGKTKKQWKIRVVWQIDESMDDGRPFIVQKRYTASLNEKATLRKELESWRGRPFTQEELDAFDLDKLIGANCQLNIQHVTKEGKLYANVVSIVPLGKNMPKMESNDYVRVQDRPDSEREPENHEPLTADDIPF
jgi:hypothetical protein